MTEVKVGKIFDDAFTKISKKLIALELVQKEEKKMDVRYIELVKTKGKFTSNIICGFSSDIFDTVIVRMNGGKMPSEDEKVLYVNEYVNIICGRALSEINNRLGMSSRLSVPVLCSDKQVIAVDGSEMESEILFYETEFGNLEVCIYYKIL